MTLVPADPHASAGCCADHSGAPCIAWPSGAVDHYTLYTEGDELYEAMHASIAGATQRIALETYLWSDDEVGRRLADALRERALAGVRVEVIVDAVGSAGRFSRRLRRGLIAAGARVRRFHRWRWTAPGRFLRRDHRKLLVVDDRTVFLGGFNIHRESARSVVGADRWRDSHVRVGGTLARAAGGLFDAFWSGDREWTAAEDTGDVLVPNLSPICRRQLRCLYLRLLRSARRRLAVTTPYFVPDELTQRELVAAARRGVDVRLLLPARSDVSIAQWAARAAYQQLLLGGVRIFEFQPRVLHAKTAVADGAIATIGTANLDYRSLFVNYELNLFSATRGLCAALERQFGADLEVSAEVTLDRWVGRPWPLRVAEAIGWVARRWL